MAANVAALLRLLRTPGASGAAAAAEAAAQERHGAVLRLMHVWTQDVINTLRPTLEQLWRELVLCFSVGGAGPSAASSSRWSVLPRRSVLLRRWACAGWFCSAYTRERDREHTSRPASVLLESSPGSGHTASRDHSLVRRPASTRSSSSPLWILSAGVVALVLPLAWG
jgi:hypothetical protein